jgi:hypothetical protein
MIDAKERWRKSPEGRAYHANYHAQYMSNEENRKRKADAQRLRRQTSAKRKEIDATYNAEYIRRPEVKAKKNLKRRLRRQTDIAYRVSERIRGRIKDLLKRNRPEAVSKSLGCTALELVAHLEKNFLPGMTWDNYGFDCWHIDHIKPLASFDLANLEQYRQACHYTNLRPLWAKDNLKKGAKIV